MGEGGGYGCGVLVKRVGLDERVFEPKGIDQKAGSSIR